jgi:hypothetical protein
VFKENKERPTEPTNWMQLRVRGNFQETPIVSLLTLKSDYILNTGPHIKTKFDENLARKQAASRRQVRQDTVGRGRAIRHPYRHGPSEFDNRE